MSVKKGERVRTFPPPANGTLEIRGPALHQMADVTTKGGRKTLEIYRCGDGWAPEKRPFVTTEWEE